LRYLICWWKIVHMRPTVRWRALTAVIRGAWHAWLFIGGLVFAFIVGLAAHRLLSVTLTDAVRYSGTVLQILGLSTVALGLRQVRRMFNRPSVSAAMLGWLRRLAATFTGPKPISLQASFGAFATMTGEARLIRGVRPGATLDERVSILEENLKLLRDELDSRLQGVRRELGTVKESIERESQERRVAGEKTARKIEEVAIGGLHLEVVGLMWLFLGVAAASIPDVIAAWLSQLA